MISYWKKKHTINKLVTVTRNIGWQDVSNFTNIRVYKPFFKKNDRLLLRRGLIGNLLSSSWSVEKLRILSCWAQTCDSTKHHTVWIHRPWPSVLSIWKTLNVTLFSSDLSMISQRLSVLFVFYSERARLYGIFYIVENDATSIKVRRKQKQGRLRDSRVPEWT
jgi:hypothetical protein